MILPLACCCNAIVIARLLMRPKLNSDFRGPYSVARFARHAQVAELYQAAPLQAFQHQLYPGFQSFFPFQYPPSALPLICWLGNFSYIAAQMIWFAAGLAALIAASWTFFAPPMRRFAVLALLAAPASLLNGAAGETGYFTAALLLAGFALLPARPMLAGIAFGLLTVKPQLGLLIPVALLARRDYRALLAAGFAMLALIACTCMMFPVGLWADWLRELPIYQAQYLAAARSLGLNGDVTIAASLTRIGASGRFAWSVQMLVSLGSAIAIFCCFRRAPYRLAVAALFTGTLLCAPHAYAYDTLPLMAAMLAAQPAPPALNTLCLTAYLAPYLLLTGAAGWFLYAIPETLIFLGIIYLAFTQVPYPNIQHEPVSAAEFEPRRT